MIAIDTHNSPRIYRKEDGVFIDVTYERDGEAYIVTAPLGDGKYHLSRALEVVMDRHEDGSAFHHLSPRTVGG